MQARLADIKEINSLQTRWDQGIALEECRVKWEEQRRKTRRYCNHCGCMLYVRSFNDNVMDEKDLDEVYYSVDKRRIYCFYCVNTVASLSILL